MVGCLLETICLPDMHSQLLLYILTVFPQVGNEQHPINLARAHTILLDRKRSIGDTLIVSEMTRRRIAHRRNDTKSATHGEGGGYGMLHGAARLRQTHVIVQVSTSVSPIHSIAPG